MRFGGYAKCASVTQSKGGRGRVVQIKDRVKDFRRVPANTLRPNPKNWRTHPIQQINAIKGVLAEVGFAGAELARELPDGSLMLIDGHARAEIMGTETVPVLVLDVNESEADKLLATFDPLGAMAEADAVKLDAILREVQTSNQDLADMLTGLAEDNGILDGLQDKEIVEDEVPEPPADPITKPGDLWLLGDHRLLCQDSTKAEDVARLMDGKKAVLIHADPPYGMGKEKDGVENDNLYADKLDAFQMAWWRVFRKHTEDNGSAYIWGNAPDLWRLWYKGGLADSERLTMRNEITWDKQHGQGMESDQHRMFPTASERALFFMLGEQGFNNNADNYWEGFEPIRAYLWGECQKIGLTTSNKYNTALGLKTSGGGMFAHHVSPTGSQWTFITREHYTTLQQAARGDAFKRDYDDLKREFYATRAYFDNTHDNMTDVWEFPRVTGEERHGHATPKPVAMICRAIKSSTPAGAIVAEPFLGSGTTLIAAEQLGRKCYGMEISAQYTDVCCNRWAALTGKSPILEETGETLEQVKQRRQGNG